MYSVSIASSDQWPKKSSAIGPERIDEIEARLAKSVQRDVQSGKRMQCCSGGKQIRNGRIGNSEKAAGWKGAREQPRGQRFVGIAAATDASE